MGLLDRKQPGELAWDEKDVKKSFNSIVTALNKLTTDINSLKSNSINPLKNKINNIENALPNKSNILKEFKREISSSKEIILSGHKSELASQLSPEKLKIVINDIMEDTLREKNKDISNLEKEVSNISDLRQKKIDLEEKVEKYKKQCDTFDAQKKEFVEKIKHLEKKIEHLEFDKDSLNEQISSANALEKSKQEKYQDFYNKIDEPESVSNIVDMLFTLSSLKKLKSRYSSSGDLFDFERKFAVLIGRLVLENKFKQDQDIITVISEVNKYLDTYEIVPPKLGAHQAIDYNIERTVNGQNDPGLFIKEYITLCVKNKTINTADSIIKALVDAS